MRFPQAKSYSKNQVSAAAFFFGPLAALYCLKKNFDAMGEPEQAQKMVRYGTLLTLTFILIAPFLPSAIPPAVYAAAYAAVAMTFYQQKQTSLNDASRFSNWNVVGYGFLWLAIFVVLLLATAMLYIELGWVNPDL
ncbi:MAG: hypothetical protein WC043_01280 [Pseudobdellovibrionaceae bacterium]